MIRNLDPCGFLRLGQGEADDQSSRAPVAGNQLPYEFGFVQGNVLDPAEFGIVESRCALYQRCDCQVVPDRFTVKIIGKRIDPNLVRCLPRGLCQFLDRSESLTGEYRSFPRGNRDQCRPRRGIGVLQFVECKEVGIVLAESRETRTPRD